MLNHRKTIYTNQINIIDHEIHKKEPIRSIIKKTTKLLVSNDGFLIRNDVCETSIAHKLAIYLSYFIKGYDIDIEYNRSGVLKDPKKMENFYNFLDHLKNNFVPDIYLKLAKEIFGNVNDLIGEIKKAFDLTDEHIDEFLKNHKKDRLFTPDIVIHIRGINDYNLLAFEIKKEATPKERFYDIIKLYFLLESFGYRFVFFIDLNKEKELKVFQITYDEKHDLIKYRPIN